MQRASCLAWYSIIFQPTLSFPAIPGGDSSTAGPQLWLCNTVVSFRPKALLLWATSQPPCVTSTDRAACCKLNIVVALQKSYEHPTLRAALLQRLEGLLWRMHWREIISELNLSLVTNNRLVMIKNLTQMLAANWKYIWWNELSKHPTCLRKVQVADWSCYHKETAVSRTLSWTAAVTGPQRSSRWRKELEPFFFRICR